MVSGSKTVIEASRKSQETKKQKKLYDQFQIEVVGKKHQQIGGLKNHYKKLGLDFSRFEKTHVEKVKKKSNKKAKGGLKISEFKTVENNLIDKPHTVKIDVQNLKNLYVHEIEGKIVLSAFENVNKKSKLKEVLTSFENKIFIAVTESKQDYNVDNNETVVRFI
jgi:hypothetical protein